MTELTPQTTKVDVTSANFEQWVLAESHKRPVVVDFWAEWCGPCRVLGPVLEKLASEDGGSWLLAKIDTESNQELALQFQIRGIPAVKAFVNGTQVDEFVGVLPDYQIRQWLTSFVPSTEDNKVEEAIALAGTDKAAALTMLTEVLEARPHHAQALLTLAKWEAEAGNKEAVTALLERIDLLERDKYAQEIAQLELGLKGGASVSLEDAKAYAEAHPNDMDAWMTLAQTLAAAQLYEEAMATYLKVIQSKQVDYKDPAREGMVALFDAAGFHSEVTRKYRSLLSQNLYI